MRACPVVHYRVFICIPGLCPLDARVIPAVGTATNVSRDQIPVCGKVIQVGAAVKETVWVLGK